MSKPSRSHVIAASAQQVDGALPSPKQLAWLLVQPPAALQPLDAAAVTRVEQDKEAALVASHARRFTTFVRGCGIEQRIRPVAPLADLDAWLAELSVGFLPASWSEP